MNTKQEIRESIAHLRNEVTPDQHDAAALRLFSEIQPYLDDANTVLVYSALSHELSLDLVIDELWSRGVTVLFPKVTGERELALFSADNARELAEGSYGVLEPRIDASQVDPATVDLAFIPGVAFSEDGARLGYGGGYYDSLLTQLNCPTIGACFDFQLIEDIPVEEHDIPVSRVISVPVL